MHHDHLQFGAPTNQQKPSVLFERLDRSEYSRVRSTYLGDIFFDFFPRDYIHKNVLLIPYTINSTINIKYHMSTLEL